MSKTYLRKSVLAPALCGLVLTIVLIGCRSGNSKQNDTTTTKKPTENPHSPESSVNIQFAPGQVLSPAELKGRFSSVSTGLPDAVTVRTCPCDTTLANVALPQNWTILQGQDPTKLTVKSSTGGAGEVSLPGGAKAGINYGISTGDDTFNIPPELISKKAVYPPIVQTGKNPAQTIKIAIFDSGLTNPANPDEQFIPSTLLVKTYLCNSGQIDQGISAARGWNFMSDLPPTDTRDTYSGLHGSRVSYLVAKQFNGTTAVPQLVPMRVLGSNNQGDLFGLLCAMETARLNQVDVFNMSLGYYGKVDELFRSYVKKAESDGIWIIAAAGNQPVPLSSSLDLTAMDPKFYPAYFTSEFTNILAVTTVLVGGSTVNASAKQNYSKNLVWGVRANQADSTGKKGQFIITRTDGTRDVVFGTSFATPIFAGWTAQQLARNPALTPAALLSGLPRGGFGNQVINNAYVIPAP